MFVIFIRLINFEDKFPYHFLAYNESLQNVKDYEFNQFYKHILSACRHIV